MASTPQRRQDKAPRAPLDSTRTLALVVGPVLAALAAAATHQAGLGDPAAATAAVTALCATWWVLEPIPIPATSLIPFAVFPLTGVMEHGEVAAAYGHTMILLLLGGFMLSAAIERSGAHRRIALGLVALCGNSGRRLVLGFMLASALCSMWISNTATTLMLLPVALAVLEGKRGDPVELPLLLGIAYAASIGGMATPIGTPPNVIFMGVYEKATGAEISFLDWMQIGVPVALIMIPLVWLWLTRHLRNVQEPVGVVAPPRLGPMTSREQRVMIVFALTAAAWIFRSAPLGGWSALFGVETAGDASVAIAAVVLMFVIPAGDDGGRLLDWPTAVKIPWGLLVLFGGGLAIASAFESSGLSVAVGGAIASLASWPTVAMIAVIAVSVTFLTEVTSNTATTTLLMPILASTAVAAHIDLPILMIPATLSASCAFMLPVATAPNAIMFGTERISTRQMAQEGFALNLMGAAVITAACAIILPLL